MVDTFWRVLFKKNVEAMAGLEKYCTGRYGRIEVYRVKLQNKKWLYWCN